jgi:polyhydroxybutyrate depolymerase
MLAYRLACELSDRIAAIGVQSATLFSEPCAPRRPLAVLAIHGTADPNVPIAGGSGAGVSGADFPPPLAGVRTLVDANGCSRPGKRSLDKANRAIAYTVWRPCAGRVTVEWVAVAGAGHAWMSVPIDSSAAVWSFVSAHPRR